MKFEEDIEGKEYPAKKANKFYNYSLTFLILAVLLIIAFIINKFGILL